MKSAKEMFEELGYVQIKEKNVIAYCKEEEEDFLGKIETTLYHIAFWSNGNLTAKEDSLPMYMDIATLRAINRQLEELGWLE